MAQLKARLFATCRVSAVQKLPWETEGARLPTGDGMALVFFGDPEAPMECAMHRH